MTDSPTQLALREWRGIFLSGRALAALAAATLVLALAGPFGTGDRLSLAGGLIYWAAITVLCYGLGLGLSLLVRAHLRAWPSWVGLGLSSALVGLAVLAVVTLTNLSVFGWWPAPGEWPGFAATVIVVAVIVNLAFNLLSVSAATAPPAAPAAAPLLDRLPLDKRGPLVSVSVEDHYVRIRTVRGEEMVLLRLSDAIRETADVAGAQVHRSHWVAFDQVRRVRREGERAILSMSHGVDIPVSRANMAKLKAAGLLPGRK